jgi:hypothetical protein
MLWVVKVWYFVGGYGSVSYVEQCYGHCHMKPARTTCLVQLSSLVFEVSVIALDRPGSACAACTVSVS